MIGWEYVPTRPFGPGCYLMGFQPEPNERVNSRGFGKGKAESPSGDSLGRSEPGERRPR
jgi:hypothetical protein